MSNSMEPVEEMRGPSTVNTNDLGLAAALITMKFKLESIVRDENGRASFVFTDVGLIKGGMSAYYEGRFKVDARTYFDNIKMLKGRIYAGK